MVNLESTIPLLSVSDCTAVLLDLLMLLISSSFAVWLQMVNVCMAAAAHSCHVEYFIALKKKNI